MLKNSLVGEKFGRWTVLEKANSRKSMAVWKCRCECGTEKEIYQKHLLSGASTSCGCYSAENASKRMRENNPTVRKHGMCETRLYRIWSDMLKRCTNPNDAKYSYYGGRGIYVCDEWKEFINFKEWALSHGYNDNLTLDRINTNKNYEPEKLQVYYYSKATV